MSVLQSTMNRVHIVVCQKKKRGRHNINAIWQNHMHLSRIAAVILPRIIVIETS